MKSNLSRAALALLCAVTLLGCGSAAPATGGSGSGGSGSGGSGGGVSIDDLGTEYAKAICTAQSECFGPLFAAFIGTEANCQAMMKASFEDSSLQVLKASIAAGRVKYDGTKVAACVASIASMACTPNPNNSDACQGVFNGQVAVDGQCHSDVDCAGNGYCLTQECPGKCQLYVGAGESCEPARCDDGLYCGEGNKCTATLADGEACTDDDQCKSDNCDNDDGKDGVCSKAGISDFAPNGTVKEGESCDPEKGILCDAGLACAFKGFDRAAGKPDTACVKPVGAGETCNMGWPSTCVTGYRCDADIQSGKFDGKCVAMPAAGEDCIGEDAAAGGPRCDLGLDCIDDKCAAKGRLGDACKDDDGCFSEKCEGGVCVAELCD